MKEMTLQTLSLIIGDLEEEAMGGARNETVRDAHIIDHSSTKTKIKSLYPDSSEQRRDPTKKPGYVERVYLGSLPTVKPLWNHIT